MTIGIQTTLVTDADTAGVVMTGMCARLRLRTARINHSVLRDVIVITDVTELMRDSLQSLAALHADGRSDGGKYCDDKIDDLLDGFFSHGLMIY